MKRVRSVTYIVFIIKYSCKFIVMVEVVVTLEMHVTAVVTMLVIMKYTHSLWLCTHSVSVVRNSLMYTS